MSKNLSIHSSLSSKSHRGGGGYIRSNIKTLEEYVLNDKYCITDVIGNGSFGKIFLASDIKSNEKVAIKVTSLMDAQVQQLRIENDMLQKLKGGKGICNVYYFGRDIGVGAHFCLIMDYLGPNLEDLFRYCGGKFSIKTVCMLAIQIIMRIEYLHSKKILHRDIKPDNFAMGRGEGFNTVYVVDFGLSRSYVVPGTDEHIPFVQTKRMMGTARYCSINSHLGLQLSRRDDLEALGYMFIYFARGSLPWQGISAAGRAEKFRLIHAKKSTILTNALCEGLSSRFMDYVNETKSLPFAAEPNFHRLKSHFINLMNDNKLIFDNHFDWLPVYQKRVTNGIACRVLDQQEQIINLS